ncbi:hypothetical protein Godav_012547 [Gossypium davidsonii]|uniref:Peptidase A1 domain-containing protein n=2 Tax=Gossypium TaxID=3633 RepID=A0A7J8REV8_GOSDV|nr:hypothetical protein [Gossypium davidsonii]MBA0647026.1 hypothetical protein [Gossypium klotzschianum]
MAAAIVFAIIPLSTLCLTDAQNVGFSVELIHRDSIKSPFYNPFETTFDRVTNAFRRSFSRVHRFYPNSITTTEANPDIIVNTGEYLMNISLGTPSFSVVALADTGSDLIWTQCSPCSQCFKQDAPLFDPTKSSTYRKMSCSSNSCENIQGGTCASPTDTSCIYSVTYGDNSFSKGDIAYDILTLGSTTGQAVALPDTIIGCGNNNAGTFSGKASGIIGLGGGEISLINQLGSPINGKFSYCLLPMTQIGKSSKMNFGSNAIVSGPGTVSTPLIEKSPTTYYFLTLKAISVGTQRIEFKGSSFGTDEGNIVIDSGTTLTLLPSDFYSQLESAMDSQFNGKTLNTFVKVDDSTACFAFSPAQNIAIYEHLLFCIIYNHEIHLCQVPMDCKIFNRSEAEAPSRVGNQNKGVQWQDIADIHVASTYLVGVESI